MTDLVRSDVDAALTRQFVGQRGLAAAAHFVLLILIVFMVRDVLPRQALLTWTAVVVAVIGLRAALFGRWGRARANPSPLEVAWTVRGTMLALGLAWGIGMAVAGPSLPAATVSLVLLGLAGLLAGGLSTLVADRWAYTIYAIAMFGPVLIGLALWGEGHVGDIGMLLIAVFLAFTIRLHAQSHAMLVQRVQTERQLAAAQAIAHIGSWEWDVAANRMTWSDELRRIYGVPPEAPATLAAFLATAHPDDRDRLPRLADEVLTPGKATDYEWRVVRPDGSIRHVQGRHVAFHDAAGALVRVAGTALDITDRHRAEENRRTLLLELQKAVAEVKTLQGILPICASCKRIRTEQGGWEAVELYVRQHTNAEFSHGLCPECVARDWG